MESVFNVVMISHPTKLKTRPTKPTNVALCVRKRACNTSKKYGKKITKKVFAPVVEKNSI
jgi:hypothetical protein